MHEDTNNQLSHLEKGLYNHTPMIRSNHPYFAIQKAIRAKKEAQLKAISQMTKENPEPKPLLALEPATNYVEEDTNYTDKPIFQVDFSTDIEPIQEEFIEVEVVEKEELTDIEMHQEAIGQNVSPIILLEPSQEIEEEIIPEPEPLPNKPELIPTEPEPLSNKLIFKEEGYHYFQAFDRCSLKGLQEIPGDVVTYPFIQIAQRQSEHEFKIKIFKTTDCQYEEAYLNLNGYYLKKQIVCQENQAFPYSYFYTFIGADTETRYHYLYQNYPNSVPETPLLADVYQAKGLQKITYEFSLLQDQFYLAPNPSPKLDILEANAETICQSTYSLDGNEIVIDSTVWNKEDKKPSTKQSSIQLSEHPFFHLDFFPVKLINFD